ncbi:hypothetical protein SAMN04487911_10216 [Arenibacter nanhaiticus]|uniref:Lysozyme inhibitor of I-type lysozyme n=1 Tax=Arenibacter nanhaiticus TaxID=558155 RepID=A0A1M6AZQ8_9FLAO|nr:PliI family lysozyme inhibitor of I-type lysozyme [Arenibacter nanhaiticus]SHI41942.1 hypothetical protein SAMN04487911_10216 [Arenibacter nanhaiticus]
MKKHLLAAILLTLIFSCKNHKENDISTDFGSNTPQTARSFGTNSTLIGDYVSGNYSRRDKGYDWVAVSVRESSESNLHISVRSRNDQKKPSCTFDAIASRVNDSTYTVDSREGEFLFVFENDVISIKSREAEKSSFLSYYCSGGSSLAGNYQKINEPLDKNQIDSRIFVKNLNYNNIGFEISSTGSGSIQELHIKPYGLTIDNQEILLDIDARVTQAEIGDLNADGFPELLIYTTSAGSGSYGDVIGYSVNGGKFLTPIYFPDISENENAKEGYMGHDQFSIIDNILVQRYKTYEVGDTNSNPTGNLRKIEYKLKDVGGSKQFVLDKIIDVLAY